MVGNDEPSNIQEEKKQNHKYDNAPQQPNSQISNKQAPIEQFYEIKRSYYKPKPIGSGTGNLQAYFTRDKRIVILDTTPEGIPLPRKPYVSTNISAF